VSWTFKQRVSQIQNFMDNPLEVQEELFQRLIAKARDTEFGVEYGFDSIKSQDDFRNRVPVHEYEDLKPYVERVMRGEQRVLWPSKISWFAKSSGTTSDKSKFIPVSKEAFDDCHFKAGKDVLSIYCHNNPDTKIFTGKGLMMGGSNSVNQLNHNTYYGDVSALMIQNMPLIGQFISTPDVDTALMGDWEEKIERMANQTVKENVTHMAGVPTWTIVLIKHLFEMTGKTDLKEVWPNMELYIHGGVSFTPYRETFNHLIGGEMDFLETYNASEGFFGLQESNDRDDILLMLDYGVYYEFMPLHEVGKEDPRTIGLADVEPGVNYAMIITTNSGLWRYMIGDTVVFTDTRPYRIKISGRVKHFINAFGEEVMVHNTDDAIAFACHATNTEVHDYTVAPIYLTGKDHGGHEWLIEFEKSPADLREFTLLLDQRLQEVNSDYEAKRHKDLALKEPVVHVLQQGTFYEWLKSKGKLGGQHKVPRLSNDRSYVEDILEFKGVTA
jgi:hypothetical protein